MCIRDRLLRDQFKINTFSVEEYIRRIDQKKLPTALTLRFTLRQRMIYYLFWTAYSTRVDPCLLYTSWLYQKSIIIVEFL